MGSQDHYALVTGASSGIGAAIARECARRGQPLLLTARREDRLRDLAQSLQPQVPVRWLADDLADPGAPTRLQQWVVREGCSVGLLVNNAGYGLPGRFEAPAWSEHQRFLQVMVTAVCELSYRFLPAMQAAGRGGILNVASLAGLVPGSAGHTLYAAAKAFMIRFSESLALENRGRGIRVTALCPGFTWSEFHDVTGTRGQVSRLPRWMWMDADQVAREGFDALERGRVVHVPGRANRWIRALTKHLPDRTALALIQRRSRDFRKT
ncbi:MAG TPA: SDR family oxidoreductase [Xanthomonadaceae bacterium]|nr:SDR family oxidoreductase [Xanthomonadaceae bacterium]